MKDAVFKFRPSNFNLPLIRALAQCLPSEDIVSIVSVCHQTYCSSLSLYICSLNWFYVIKIVITIMTREASCQRTLSIKQHLLVLLSIDFYTKIGRKNSKFLYKMHTILLYKLKSPLLPCNIHSCSVQVNRQECEYMKGVISHISWILKSSYSTHCNNFVLSPTFSGVITHSNINFIIHSSIINYATLKLPNSKRNSINCQIAKCNVLSSWVTLL